jgi:hypothetical protein
MDPSEPNIIDIASGYVPMLVIELDDGRTVKARPCACNEPMNADDDEVALVRWEDGTMMLCHKACLQRMHEDD